MFLLIAIACTSYLFSSGRSNQQTSGIDVTDSITIYKIPPTEQPKEVEPPKPKPMAVADVATVKDFVPVIKPDDMVPETEVPSVDVVDTSAYGNENKAGDAVTAGQNVSSDDPGTPGGNGESNKPAAPEPVMPSGPIDMHQADEMPEYPGGAQALVRYMVNNLTSELEPGMKYVLKAQFVINETGQVSEAVILSSDDANLNNQVLKALRKMKQWKPGKFQGRNVAVRFTMPVTFVGPEE